MVAEDIVSETRGIVCVPDLPWRDLIAAASRKLGREHIHECLLKEDLYRGERGRTYEAIAWKSGRVVHGVDVYARFRQMEFVGNPVVFVAWSLSMIDSTVRDRFITVPDRDRTFRYKGREDLALCLLRGYRTCGYGCSLTLSMVFKPMHTHWSFVAFKEIEAPHPG
jgi:hypothetical protein